MTDPTPDFSPEAIAALAEIAKRAPGNNGWAESYAEDIPALLAALEEVTAERDLLAEMLPPLTPDFAKLMERLDFQTSQLDRTVSEYPDMLRLIHSARHAIRYASDGEQGNAVMRNRLATAEAALEAERENERLREALEPAMPMLRSLWPKVAAALAPSTHPKGEGE